MFSLQKQAHDDRKRTFFLLKSNDSLSKKKEKKKQKYEKIYRPVCCMWVNLILFFYGHKIVWYDTNKNNIFYYFERFFANFLLLFLNLQQKN